MRPTPTHLYRLFDDEDRLLYVGVTEHLEQRVAHHRRRQSWGDRIARVQLDHFTPEDFPFTVEQQVILAERPLHNVSLSEGQKRRRLREDLAGPA